MHPELRTFTQRYLGLVGFCLMGVMGFTFLNLPYASLDAAHSVRHELSQTSPVQPN